MLDVGLPDTHGPQVSARSFQACLCSVLEIPPQDAPAANDTLQASIARWRTWLAGRGCGLVPIARAPQFQWPGYWIAVLDHRPTSSEDTVVLMFGSPPGVVLSPQDPALLGSAAKDLRVVEGYVIARFDPTSHGHGPGEVGRGRVEMIAIAERAEAPMREVETVSAIPGRGLVGDRYANATGTFTPRAGKAVGYDLTLIEAEVLDRLRLPDGGSLGYADARRNIITSGVDLNSLVGRRFTIGQVECIGRRLCEPCAHLERLTRPGVLRRLIHSGGLRADILTAGTISKGAPLQVLRTDA